MHRLRLRLPPLAKATLAVQRRTASNHIHVMPNGKVIDPTTDKNLVNWTVAIVDIGDIRFQNPNLQYFSYDPPKGFTPEEIMLFGKEGECLCQCEECVFTIGRVRELIPRRDESERGTLNIRVNEETIDRWNEEGRALMGF